MQPDNLVRRDRQSDAFGDKPNTLVRRGPHRPLVWLGERERPSDVQPMLGERFGAWQAKERDFVHSPRVKLPRDPVG